jgi:hypothetical protein
MKWFTVATEGQTTDGREIERSWLEEIAATYSRAKYGARIWMEHIRGVLPDSPFKAYGDVLAVRVEENDDGKLELQAQLDPTPELVAMTKARQKIYTSIEIEPNFAKTGKHGLIGLGVTDSPASLGTSILAFSAKHPNDNPLAGRKQSPGNLFTSALETKLEFSEASTDPGQQAAESFFTRLGEFFRNMGQQPPTDKPQDKPTASPDQAGVMQAFSEFQAAYLAGQRDVSAKLEKFASELSECKKTFASADELKELRDTLDKTPDGFSQRPPATGKTGAIFETDC